MHPVHVVALEHVAQPTGHDRHWPVRASAYEPGGQVVKQPPRNDAAPEVHDEHSPSGCSVHVAQLLAEHGRHSDVATPNMAAAELQVAEHEPASDSRWPVGQAVHCDAPGPEHKTQDALQARHTRLS